MPVNPSSFPPASLQPWIIHGSDSWIDPPAACGVTVGNFDGVHLGHAEIIRRLVATARQRSMPAVALTFNPHPAAIVRPGQVPPPLTTMARRAELLLALGLDAVLVQPADAALMALSAEQFFSDVLQRRLRGAALVEGADFRFGAARQGDIALLQSLCNAANVSLEVVPPVIVGEAAVSSSRIRELVATGRVDEAAALATAPYRLTGTVIEGAKRGGPLGFPTANLGGIATLLPAQGVYAGWATVDGGRERHPAAIHIGPNVSFGVDAVSVEAHLIGFRGDLYGRTLHVDFLTRLRDTRRFASLDELTAQLTADVARATEIARHD
ncbi:MAG: bifunctional riboflavin kinase/FAD synthetase [Planctomycetota bacterium]|nr:bifunctional riboflavin kinase/FAD synthetase [Planctomycetota bacterium]